MEILEAKHISPYLPYGVKMQFIIRNKVERTGVLTRIDHDDELTHPTRLGIDYYDIEHVWMFKPILRPMSDLNVNHTCMVEINQLMSCEYNGHNTFIELNSCNNDPYNVMYLPYNCFEKLLSHHFDVFGLIEKGFAIDISTLK